jgi:hypothetical protein
MRVYRARNGQRDTTRVERDDAARERDAARVERDGGFQERNRMLAVRETAQTRVEEVARQWEMTAALGTRRTLERDVVASVNAPNVTATPRWRNATRCWRSATVRRGNATPRSQSSLALAK